MPEIRRRVVRATVAEVILAAVTTGWAVLLWVRPPDVRRSEVLTGVTGAVGGIRTFVMFLVIIAALQWIAVFVAGWPPKARAVVMFTVVLWWTFITLLTFIIRWSSVLWPTTAGLVALAFIVWLRLRNDIVCAEFHKGGGGPINGGND